MPAAEVVFLLARSCAAWRRRFCAASSAISFCRAAMAAMSGIAAHFELGELDVGLALSMAYWDSSSVARASASALMTCCSASARSASASRSLNSCSVVSNCTTTSPGCTSSPGSRRSVIGHIGAADHRRGEHFGVAALQFAARGDGEGDAALFDLGGGEFEGGGGGCGADQAHGAPGEGADHAEDGDEDQQGCGASFLGILLFGIDQRHHGAGRMPVIATSSGLRARTSTPTGR